MRRLSVVVDLELHEEQAGLGARGCIGHILTLRNICKERTEWLWTLYVNYEYFSKAFDSVHRYSLWKILRAFGIPSHLTEIIKRFYGNVIYSVGDGDILFEVHTGVRQGCVMSTLLFSFAVDWVMRHTTEDQIRGIRSTSFSYLEDLDQADDVASLSHTQAHIQEKTQSLKVIPQK